MHYRHHHAIGTVQGHIYAQYPANRTHKTSLTLVTLSAAVMTWGGWIAWKWWEINILGAMAGCVHLSACVIASACGHIYVFKREHVARWRHRIGVKMNRGACAWVPCARPCASVTWVRVARSLWWPLRVATVSRVTRLYSLKPMERIVPR